MRQVEGGVVIPTDGSVEFRPGGYHVMLFDVDMTEDTTDVALTFDFETGNDVTVIADITDVSKSGSQSYGSDHDNHGKESYGSGH